MCYKCYMRSIGIRELRQHASQYLRQVQQGETIEITDRGQPVALLTPVPAGSQLEELAARGQATRPTDDLLALDPLASAAAEGGTPSEVLAAMREHER